MLKTFQWDCFYFLLGNHQFKHTAFNYCVQWSGEDHNKILFYYFDECHVIHRRSVSLKGIADIKRNAQTLIRPKRETLLLPEMQVTRKTFIRVAANFFFLMNLIEFFKKHLHLKNYSNRTFLYGKSPTFCCSKRKNVNS